MDLHVLVLTGVRALRADGGGEAMEVLMRFMWKQAPPAARRSGYGGKRTG